LDDGLHALLLAREIGVILFLLIFGPSAGLIASNLFRYFPLDAIGELWGDQ